MNKSQMIDAIAAEAKITKVDARKSFDAFVSVMSDALRKRDRIAITGFGSFSVVQKPGRIGRNPRTGAQIKIVPKNTVKFRAGADLMTKVK